jgi:hypothetical protein
VGLENSYNFINLANNQDLGINTGRFGRLNSSAINSAFELMQREFNTGVYRNDSFYVFTESEYVSPEIIAYHKNMAITTLSADSAYGELNGFTFIAPNLNLCQNKNRLSNNVNRFGVPETQMYKGQLIKFDNKRKNFIYALTGFSEFEDWGTWSLGELSKVTLNTTELSNFSQINIRGKDFVLPLNSIEVFLNGTKIGNCSFELNFSTCSLPFKFSNLANSIINLDFRPLKIRSPEMLNISEDTRNIGFGLSSISLS